MSTQDNNAVVEPRTQTGQAQPQAPETAQASSAEDEDYYPGDDDFYPNFGDDSPSDEEMEQVAIELHEAERFQRTINTRNFQKDDIKLFDAFYKEIDKPKIQSITVPTLLGEKSLFGAFTEIVKCTQHFGTHPRYPLDDIGMGNLFANAFKNKLRYVPERKQWYQYAEGKWGPGDEEAMECCKALTHELKQYASNDELYSKTDVGKRINTLANKWMTRRGRETILKDAASIYPISLTEFDTQAHLFNCLNGTLDLDTGEFREHRAEDLLSKMAEVEYDADAKCPLWEQHIDEVMLHDKEMVTYLQQALGYALTGYTNYECFFILYGATSRNGKGVTMETFKKLVGDYGRSASPDTITQKKAANGGAPSEDIARLAGARFVNISEPDENMTLSSALVKTLTGNDTVVARYLHQNSFEYKPTYKIFINTNYLPTVTDPTVFLSGRVKIIPFRRHFEPHEQKKELKRELAEAESLSGILNWCLAGWNLLKNKTEFDEPAAVKATIKEYEQASSTVAQYQENAKTVFYQEKTKVPRFIDEVLEKSPGDEVFTKDVHEEYCRWCKANGLETDSLKAFNKEMAAYASIKKKRPADKSSPSSRSMILGYKFKNKE